MEPSAPERSLVRRDHAVALAFLLVAFALGLVGLLRSADAAWPHSILYEGDAPVWAIWAQHLDRGEPFEFDLAFRTPGVAFLLHWLGLSEPPFTAAKILWCGISAATTASLYLVLARYFSRRAGAIAALLHMVSFGTLALATSLNNDAPYAFLLTLVVGATLAWRELPSWRLAAALGVLHGAAMLLRAEHLLLALLLTAYAGVAGRRAGFGTIAAHAAVLAAACAATLAPWTIRSHRAAKAFNTVAEPAPYDSLWPEWNAGAIDAFESLPAYARGPSFGPITAFALRERLREVGGDDIRRYFEVDWGYTPRPLPEWCVVSFKGPLDFALANDPRADGGFSRAALADARDPNPPFAFARPTHARLVADGYAVGLASIRADPAAWRTKAAEKLRRFGDGATLGLFASNWPHASSLVRHPIDIATPARGDAPIWSGALLAALAFGAVAACLRAGGPALVIVVVYRVIVVVAFYGYARHAASIAPVLFAIAAIGLDAVIARAARLRLPGAIVAPARFAMLLAAVALVAAAFLFALKAPVRIAQLASTDGLVTPAPQWGDGAFESNDRLILTPLPD